MGNKRKFRRHSVSCPRDVFQTEMPQQPPVKTTIYRRARNQCFSNQFDRPYFQGNMKQTPFRYVNPIFSNTAEQQGQNINQFSDVEPVNLYSQSQNTRLHNVHNNYGKNDLFGYRNQRYPFQNLNTGHFSNDREVENFDVNYFNNYSHRNNTTNDSHNEDDSRDYYEHRYKNFYQETDGREVNNNQIKETLNRNEFGNVHYKVSPGGFQNSFCPPNINGLRFNNYSHRNMTYGKGQNSLMKTDSQNSYGVYGRRDLNLISRCVEDGESENISMVKNVRKKEVRFGNAKKVNTPVSSNRNIETLPPIKPVNIINQKRVDTKKSNLIAAAVRNSSNVSEYAKIPGGLLFCYICREGLWNAQSFEDHLKSDSHEAMVNALQHTYELRIELLKSEVHAAELKRQSSLLDTQKCDLEFCNMCGVKFVGEIGSHKTSEGHQRLKNFLHPKCPTCLKSFSNRIELVKHNLSVDHLKKLNELRKQRQPDLDDSFDLLDFIEDLNDESEICFKIDGGREVVDEEEVCAVQEIRFPSYNPDVALGKEALVERTGYYCKICQRFILSENDVELHCQSLLHYNRFRNLWHAQIGMKRSYDAVTCQNKVYTFSINEPPVKRRKISLSAKKHTKKSMKSTTSSRSSLNETESRCNSSANDEQVESKCDRTIGSTEAVNHAEEKDKSEVNQENENDGSSDLDSLLNECDTENELNSDQEDEGQTNLKETHVLLSSCVVENGDQVESADGSQTLHTKSQRRQSHSSKSRMLSFYYPVPKGEN